MVNGVVYLYEFPGLEHCVLCKLANKTESPDMFLVEQSNFPSGEFHLFVLTQASCFGNQCQRAIWVASIIGCV